MTLLLGRENQGTVEHLLVECELKIPTAAGVIQALLNSVAALLANAPGRDSRRDFFLVRYAPGKKISRNVQPFLLSNFSLLMLQLFGRNLELQPWE